MTKERLVHLGEAVRRHRRRIGLTQEQLGTPHVSKSFVSQLERGTVSPSLLTLFHIGERLKLSPARLLMESDPVEKARAKLDMAEAALLMEGVGSANEWIRRLDQLLPVRELSRHGLAHRWQRYKGLSRLLKNKHDTAISFLESAQSDGQPVTAYWLGLAYRQQNQLLQALRWWESIIPPSLDRASTAPSLTLLHMATRLRLIELYEAIGDDTEAKRARASLDTFVFMGTPGSQKTASVLPEPSLLAWAPLIAGVLWNDAKQAWSQRHLTAAAALARAVPLLRAGISA